MKTKKILKVIQPHTIFITLGFLLVIAFFHPLFIENKSMNQNDVFQGIGSGQEASNFRQETGEEALWTNSMFSGMPAYLINISWSGDLIKYVQHIITLKFPSAAQVTILGFLSCYFMLLIFKVRPWLAFIGAIAFSFNTFSIISIEAGHIWKVRAIAYMPLVMGSVHMLVTQKKKLLPLGLLSLAVALEIQSNHLQITYYLLLMLIIYSLFYLVEMLKSKQYSKLKNHIILLILAGIMGAGANTGRIWTTLEYSKYSTRGPSELMSKAEDGGDNGLDKDYVFNWSYGILESFTFLIPNFSGGASQQILAVDSNLGKALSQSGMNREQVRNQLKTAPTYWGDQPITAGPTYAGAIMCFLFVLGIIILEPKIRNWILVACVFSILLAWGKNLEWFNYALFDYFPGYDKFRSVSMAIVIFLVGIPLMSMLALETLLNRSKNQMLKPLIISAAISGGIALTFLIISSLFDYKGAVDIQLANVPNWFLEALRADRQSMLERDALRTFVLIGIAFILILGLIKEKIKLPISLLGISVLVVFDFWSVNRRYINDENYQKQAIINFIDPSPADQFIKNNASQHYRVLNLNNPFNEAKTSANHSSLGGYHGAKIKRYQELIENCLSKNLTDMIIVLQNGSKDLSKFIAVNMLNAQYLKFGDQTNNILHNEHAFGNAWFTENIISVESPEEELAAICSIVNKNTTVMNTKKYNLLQSNYDAAATITLKTYQPNFLKYSVNNQNASFAVFSEIYYPLGWQATVDGVPTEIKQVNYVLRGLDIPANSKEVIFKFKPASYFIGNKIMAAFSATVLLILIFGLFITITKK